MKKTLFVCATLVASLVFVSCGSSKESAYRKAYEKAKAQEQAQQPVQQQAPVVTPLQEAPAQQTVVASNDNVTVRRENVSVLNGGALKAYSVVVGSFGVRANAEGLQNTLARAGYNSLVAYSSERNMYRVIISTFDNKENAVQSRNSVRATYPDAWLLMK